MGSDIGRPPYPVSKVYQILSAASLTQNWLPKQRQFCYILKGQKSSLPFISFLVKIIKY
jgi:hypothetical protein